MKDDSNKQRTEGHREPSKISGVKWDPQNTTLRAGCGSHTCAAWGAYGGAQAQPATLTLLEYP